MYVPNKQKDPRYLFKKSRTGAGGPWEFSKAYDFIVSQTYVADQPSEKIKYFVDYLNKRNTQIKHTTETVPPLMVPSGVCRVGV